MSEDPTIPAPDRYLDATFGEGGYLARVQPGYRPRVGQRALAQAVDRAIVEHSHLISEAPTATGKSFAYGVPASYHASQTGRVVVLVTANIALQEQLVNKDLPALQKAVPWPFTFSLFKGLGNYLCLDRYDRAQNILASGGPSGSMEEQRQALTVEQWATATIDGGTDSETGDKSELPFEPSGRLWSQYAVESSECRGRRCRYYDSCFGKTAHRRAREARVVVTNYALLYAHLNLLQQTREHKILPAFDVCILDEAHEAADIARDHFGFRISSFRLRRLAGIIKNLHLTAGHELEEASTQFFHALVALRSNKKRYKARLLGHWTPEEMELWGRLKKELNRTQELLNQEVLNWNEHYGRLGSPEALSELQEAELHQKQSKEIAQQLEDAVERTANDHHVYFLDSKDDGRRVDIAAKLLHPSTELRPWLYDRTDSVVAVSATLAVDGGSFVCAREELGSPPTTRELQVESPFDWKTQCLFVVPKDLPEPNDPSFREATARYVERIVLLAGGRTLGLFTSRRAVEHTYDAIVGTCRRQGITLYKQDDRPRTQLIDLFRNDVQSVLLGTKSFWTGVDVTGESLSVVVLDRLPFPPPDDPILDALSEVEPKWFFRYSVPRAILAFKQGFGRLIRSSECRGVVVCLDTRLLTKAYRRQFLNALPDVPKSTRLESIAEWLNPPAWDAI